MREDQLDNLIPIDFPERVKFNEFHEYMLDQGTVVNYCKPRWENPFYRYLVATADIKEGEDVLAVPYSEWITLQMVAKESELCKKLCGVSDI